MVLRPCVLRPQFEHFAGRGRRVVAVDLRGHGESDKPRQAYTIGAFSDDLAWICGRLGLAHPVVIGHSMGGITAFDLAARYPELPSAIVMLDAAIVLPAGAREAIPKLPEALRGPGYREALREYVVDSLFIPTDDPERKGRILERMSAAPQHVMVSAMEGLRDYDAAAAGRPPAPGLYIAADEAKSRSDMTAFHEMFPEILYGKTVGSGHFCQLEVPDQVNAMVERFLAVTA